VAAAEARMTGAAARRQPATAARLAALSLLLAPLLWLWPSVSGARDFVPYSPAQYPPLAAALTAEQTAAAADGANTDVTEVPVAIQLIPFESDANWAAKKAQIAAWNLPPTRISSHFLQFWGLKAVGPDVDWEQLEFWTKRAFRRLNELSVEVVGIYGGFFAVPEGFPRDEAMAQGLRFSHLLADYAEQYNMTVALEPLSDLTTLWPRYLEGIEFAKQVNRPSVKVMADLNYFIKLDQPLEHIAIEPEYCAHVHIAEGGGQPGTGDRSDVYKRLFRILRDIG
jgi:sugar phosphate isomerase/epimerase